MPILLITLFAFFSGQLFAQTQQFTLDNGLKILVKEDHRVPIAISMIWYNVGSSDESGGTTGTSHALEHLMFKGTKKHPQGVFSKTIAALGGQDNAFTSNDYTAFHEKIAATHLAVSFELEADRMQHLLLDKNEFTREMNVIQEERRMRTDTNPQALAYERFLATAHLASPYHHPVIGWMSDLKRMTVNDAKTWYQRYYAPNNATLVVVGDVNATTVHALAKRYFGAIPRHSIPVRKSQMEPPALGKKTVLVQTEAQIPILIMGYTVPSLVTVSPDQATTPYALDLISGILEAGSGGRLNQYLVRDKQIASAVNVNYNKYARYQTQFIILGAPSKTHTLGDLKKGILTEISRLQSTPVSEQELQRIKTQIIAQKTFERDTIDDQAMEMGMLETVGLGWQTGDKYVERLNSITAEQIQKIAQHYFQEKNMTEARLIPATKN